jgi:hypothetical protein
MEIAKWIRSLTENYFRSSIQGWSDSRRSRRLMGHTQHLTITLIAINIHAPVIPKIYTFLSFDQIA